MNTNAEQINDLRYSRRACVEVTKEFTFDSAHYLKDYIGKCANMHGHTYKLQVTVKGQLDMQGMVLDFGELKELVKSEIIDVCDHKVLNDIFNFNTTAENMSVFFYDMVHNALMKTYPRVSLIGVRLWETPTSYSEFRGEY